MMNAYPVCKTLDMEEDWFGIKLKDPYAWLKDADNQEVKEFVSQENAYTDRYFDEDQLKSKIQELKAAELPAMFMDIHPWKDGYLGTIVKEGKYDIRILDDHFNVRGHLESVPAYKEAVVFKALPNPAKQNIVAFQLLKPKAARPTVAVIDIDTETVLTEIEEIFDYTWSKQDGCLYYSTTDAGGENSISSFFKFDCTERKEHFLFASKTYSVFGEVYGSGDGKFILAMDWKDYSLAEWTLIEVKTGNCQALTTGPVEWKYIDSIQGVHYFITLSEAARGAVIALDCEGNKKVVMPEGDRILKEGFACKGKLFVNAMKDVSACLVEAESGHEIELPANNCDLLLLGKEEDTAFLQLNSFIDSPRVIAFDGVHMKTVFRVTEETYPNLIVEQDFAKSNDGTMIPYYVVHQKEAQKNQNNPTLMYGYGGYNFAMPPDFYEPVTNIQIAKWVEQGGIYVHCNIRGGNEYGPVWHEQGMKLNKKHCYEDFISIAEKIISDGWTKPEQIGISGCSNGGLLMSALVTMRPDLWGCVIDSVPHTDMIHFAEDDRGPMYITEYGNPRESKEMFEYLLSYSPYHNIRSAHYPAIYIQTGELDNNVPPYHGKKFAARMQHENTSDNPVLLRVLAEGSHDRGKGEVYWETIAQMQLFLEEHLFGKNVGKK